MNAMGFVREQCANYAAQTGRCVLDAGCLVAAGKRCGYFEEHVLSLADRPSPPGDPGRQSRLRAARAAYLKAHELHPAAPESQRACPDCGRLLPPRARYCAECASKRRKTVQREASKRRREQAACGVNS